MDNKEILERIQQRKKELNAVILAHNYQAPGVQDMADHVGDSLELSRIAAGTDSDVIVFCGVRFMAETAYILSPQKTVIQPVLDAGCPLADMVDLPGLKKMQAAHPAALTVCYVNSSAGVKAASHVCCTSANAVSVVDALGADKEIIFVPDKHLGDYVAKKLDRDIILADGFCPTHNNIDPAEIKKLKEQYPDAEVAAHPECTGAVLALADHICSTSQMIRAVAESGAKHIIVATEKGLLHRLKNDNPDKEFHLPGECVCPDMKKITLEKVLESMETMENKITVPEDVRKQALGAIEKMLDYV